MTNAGLWPYIICELTILSLSNPNHPMKFLFFPCEFKAKYYPFIIFILFSIMNSLVIDLEVLVGFIYAFLYHYLIKTKLKISDSLVIRMEKLEIFKCVTQMKGFISVNNGGNKYLSNLSNNINQKIKDISISQVSKGFTPFQGEGSTVGGNYGIMNNNDYAGINQNTSAGSNQKSQIESLDVKIK